MTKNHSIIVLIITVIACPGLVSAQELTPEEQSLINLVNAARAEAGVPQVEVDLRLAAVARSHSLDMARNRFFSHSSPTTGEMSDRLNTAGVPFRRAGENIGLDHSVADAHNSFMESTHHRANVLNPDFTRIGVGIIRLGERVMVTQAFLLPSRPPAQPPAPPTTSATTGDPQSETASLREGESSPPNDGRAEPSTTATSEAREESPQLTSPFGATPVLPSQAEQEQQQAEGPNAPESAEAPSTNSPTPGPGIWVVTRDGQFHQVELSPDILLRMLSSM